MTDTLITLEQVLDAQARIFTAQNCDGDTDRGRAYIVVDLEFLFDRDAHRGYVYADRDTAEKSIRWPFHKVAAASWLVMRFRPGDDVPEVAGPVTVALDELDERSLIEALFEALRENPNAVLTSWGGEVRDIPVLRHRAALYGLVLPTQLRNLSAYAPGRLDLCQATSAIAKSVHLPEYAAAGGIPSKPHPANEAGALAEDEEWAKVREQVCADVLTTSVIALRHRASHDLIHCEREPSVMAIAEAAAASFPDSAFIRRDFKPWAKGKLSASRLRGIVYRADA